jgi:chaperonin GroES
MTKETTMEKKLKGAGVQELRPCGNRLVVRRIETGEEKTPGGLIVPDVAKERPQQGKVIAVGPYAAAEYDRNEDRGDINIAVGDLVLFGKYAGTEIKYDDVTYLIMEDKDIIAKIAETEA